MSTALAPIETRYAGCRFRSRLEARWAVFFDHLGVEWQYEPQGYTVGPDATPYLPDFWLPGMKLWVEVKGQLEHRDLQTLIYAASEAGLPGKPGGDAPSRRLFPWRSRLLVLGQVPEPGEAWLHSRIDVVAHDLVGWQLVSFVPTADGIATLPVNNKIALNEFVSGRKSEAGLRRQLVDGTKFPLLAQPWRIADAYRAARSARFEHGESGAAR